MIVKQKFAMAATDTGVYLLGLTGIASVGQVITDLTGQDPVFWIVALLGAILLRRHIGGPDAGKVTLGTVGTGVFIAWLAVNPVLNAIGLDHGPYKPLVTALLAGGGEHGMKFLVNVEFVKAWLGMKWKK